MAVELQDVLRPHAAVLVGLIAYLTGSRLQETILTTSRRLIQVGQAIIDGQSLHEGDEGTVLDLSALRSGKSSTS